MSLQIFNPEKVMIKATPRKHYERADEVLNDEFLTPTQKKLVLEAMLIDAKDMMRFDSEGGIQTSKLSSRLIDEIIKAKTKLQGKLV